MPEQGIIFEPAEEEPAVRTKRTAGFVLLSIASCQTAFRKNVT